MLTAKQEQFAQNIILGMTQADAYRNSYNAQKMTDKQIHEEASKLMATPKISQRVQELRAEIASKNIMTAQERLEYLTDIIKDIVKEKKAVAVNGEVVEQDFPVELSTKLKAIDIMNKMQGEYVAKVEGNVSIVKLEDLL